MKKPRDRGVEIGPKRFAAWLAHFSGYRIPITHGMIELWMKQFSPQDQDLAARILDAVLFLNTQHIHTRFRESLESIEGWHKQKGKRAGRWFFVPFSGSAGESGDSMVHAFRTATLMTSKAYNDLFVYRSDLVSLKPGPDDTVVLIDDFCGSGNQACGFWKIFDEVLAGRPRIILMLVAATQLGLRKIADETKMDAMCGTILRSKDNVFDPDCTHFSAKEKEVLFDYCHRVDKDRPRGYGDTGLLVVLAHKCPNNSLPILHATNHQWDGLFPRHG